LGKPPAVYEIELHERTIRVEEELKHQRELIRLHPGADRQAFRRGKWTSASSAVDRRFEALTSRIDRFMFWSFAITLTVGGLVVAALKLLLP